MMRDLVREGSVQRSMSRSARSGRVASGTQDAGGRRVAGLAALTPALSRGERERWGVGGSRLEEADQSFGFGHDGVGDRGGAGGAVAEDAVEVGGVGEQALGFGGDGGELGDEDFGEGVLEGAEAF